LDNIEFLSITNLVFKKIIPRIETHHGLSVFAKEKAKFEGWLKVELCSILFEHFNDVTPERNRIDLTFKNWAIELKTINTNYRFPNVVNKSRPITKNVTDVLYDIKKLKDTDYSNKAVLFVVFPAKHENTNWQTHLKKISSQLQKIEFKEFKFKDDIPGILYFGFTY